MTSSTASSLEIIVGVLALQGAFHEHVQLLRQAAQRLASKGTNQTHWTFKEIRTALQLESCDALIIPGGESTTISLVAQRSNMLEPLRSFVKVLQKPTWGTCAGLILLAESANRTKQGGQELVGGLDVRVNRNHFGRQIESFEVDLDLPFLTSNESEDGNNTQSPFRAIFIRAPIVERLLPSVPGVQETEAAFEATVEAPSRNIDGRLAAKVQVGEVEIMATLPSFTVPLEDDQAKVKLETEAANIVAVRQTNVFGTSFHPELTGDPRIHVWWLEQVVQVVEERRNS